MMICYHASPPNFVFGALDSIMVAVFTPWKLEKTSKWDSSLPESGLLNICQHIPKEELVLRR